MSREKVRDVRTKLAHYESMTWSSIEGPNNHFVSVGDLAKAARDRLTAIRQDDVDELFSLRLSGKERIYGVRVEAVLRLLWWDPYHEVYPVEKKHT